MTLSSCGGNGANYFSNVSAMDTMAADTVPVYITRNRNSFNNTDEEQQIRVPITFDPQTPLTDVLRNANLEDMVVEKYNSFKNKKNRRKHNPVLYRRDNGDGVIDLTKGGPLSYEEEWELIERGGGHTLSDHFYDAAYIEEWGGKWVSPYFAHDREDPEFKYVSVTSNLAKVYFIDDFPGFVRYNSTFCSEIIKRLQKEFDDAHQREVEGHQKMYE